MIACVAEEAEGAEAIEEVMTKITKRTSWVWVLKCFFPLLT
jgi:hypothetical protein